jgi:hypothetical protein
MKATRIITIVSSATVVVAVLAGLYLSGSPGEQRLLRLDERRVSDMLQLSYDISRYWEQSGRLPPELAALVDGQRLRRLPTDPQTELAYRYEIADMDSYRLCAEFSRPSIQAAPEDFWAHQAGTQCFELNVEPDSQ